MLLNFIFPTAGSAEILGLDCVKESLEIKRIVGYVSSDVRYYHGMTSLDIFNYTAAFHRLKNKEKLIDYYMAYFEINPNKKIADLSLMTFPEIVPYSDCSNPPTTKDTSSFT